VCRSTGAEVQASGSSGPRGLSPILRPLARNRGQSITVRGIVTSRVVHSTMEEEEDGGGSVQAREVRGYGRPPCSLRHLMVAGTHLTERVILFGNGQSGEMNLQCTALGRRSPWPSAQGLCSCVWLEGVRTHVRKGREGFEAQSFLRGTQNARLPALRVGPATIDGRGWLRHLDVGGGWKTLPTRCSPQCSADRDQRPLCPTAGAAIWRCCSPMAIVGTRMRRPVLDGT